MPHQKAMVYKMLEIEKSVFGTNASFAMMSDKPGAGKSYAILAFLYITNKVIFKRQSNKVNLIVVPYNICSQWFTYLERMYAQTDMSYKCLTEYQDIITLYSDPTILFQHDILLTTSLYFGTIAQTLGSLNLPIQRVFFDEADSIKQLMMTQMDCKMTWFVSASMGTLFDKSDQCVIGKYKLHLPLLKHNNVACDQDFINENIILPPPIAVNIQCRNIYHALLVDLLPEHVDKLEAMDYSCIKQYAANYNNLKFNLDNEQYACQYIFCGTIGLLSYNEQRIKGLESDLTIITRKYNIAVEYNEKEAGNILAQMEEMKKQISDSQEIINKCNTVFVKIKSFKEQYKFVDFINGPKMLSKLDIIKQLIVSQKNLQILLFTDYDYIYQYIRQFLNEQSIAFKELDGGNIKTMETIINGYKNKEFNILMADSSMFSCGMNLENTDGILVLHKMNALKEKQIIGRAHRYGRVGALNVTHIDYC